MKQNKRFYEPPCMEVVELKHRQMLLAGSQTNPSETQELEDESDSLF